jgi:hypothetical protein
MAGDTILDVLSNPVRTPADVHNAISRAEESGKREICNAGQDKERLHSIRRATRILSAADALGAASRVGSTRSSHRGETAP